MPHGRDTIGLLINLAVTPGDVQDRHMIAPLLAIARMRFSSLKKTITGAGVFLSQGILRPPPAWFGAKHPHLQAIDAVNNVAGLEPCLVRRDRR